MPANSDMSPDREYVIGMLSLQTFDARSAMEQRKQHLGKFKDQSASRRTYHPTPYSSQQIKTILKERTRGTIPASDSNENPDQADTSNTIFRAILLICLPIIFFLPQILLAQAGSLINRVMLIERKISLNFRKLNHLIQRSILLPAQILLPFGH